ncbi:TIR domain-containing protein [Bosea sp. OK403]|nr:TIR domain-containing protein [Bosea sp. OK403]
MAREVVDVIEGLGLTAFAQFRDMGPGANFVREMQRGLVASARVIALYSPDYEASHQCQAEWSAAYNADPAGEQRKLLPFLLRPTRLNPLAQQIVYKSLVGLSTAERRAAIIEAIEHRKQTTVMEAAAAELAAAASPDIVVTAAGRIDTAPNAIFDRAVVTSDLATLPKRQQILCQAIIQYAPANTPAMFKGCFKIYGKHLGQPIAAIVPGMLDDQWKTASAYLVGREAIEFDAGLTKTLELFAQNHSEIITHFPLREERERLLAETPIDEQAAVGEALTDPIESVRQAVEAAAEADQVTSAVVDHVGDLADRAEALAPPVAPVSNEPASTISPRRRLVLTSLGFFERLYAAIGSTASVLSTETGRSLFNAAREAADALMRFIR